MTVTSLWLVRHGEPAARIRGRCYGRLDAGLSEEGRRQLESVARRLASEPLRAIYTSPRQRALQSAEILSGPQACGVRIDPDLREIDFGDFEGLTYDEISQRYPDLYRLWMEQPTDVEFPNGESFAKLRARVAKSVSALLDRHAGESVAVVTHGGVIRAVLADVLSVPPPRIFRIAQPYAAVNLIRYVESEPVIELVNGSGQWERLSVPGTLP